MRFSHSFVVPFLLRLLLPLCLLGLVNRVYGQSGSDESNPVEQETVQQAADRELIPVQTLPLSDTLRYGFYQRVSAGADALPFWLHAQRDGSVDPRSSMNSLTGFQFEAPLFEPNGDFQMHVGSELVTRFSDRRNNLWFQQIFASAKLGVLSLKAGRYYETVGMHLPELSSGSMIQSRSATPIPRISLQTNRFVDIPYTSGIVQFHARYAEGFMERDRFTRSPRLHQKSFHLKFNVQNLSILGGVLHNVQWGGDHPEYGRLPYFLSDYLRVVFSQPADPGSDMPDAQKINRIGNTVGVYDFSLIYRLQGARLLAYRHFYIEDVPATQFRSPWDGVWGVGYRRSDGNSLISSVLYEHIYTLTQDAKGYIPKGRSNYYNHSFFKNGWSYFNQAIGNPLLTYDRITNRFTNNMVVGHHLGIAGRISSALNYRFMGTYSRNYGVCTDRMIRRSCGVYVYTRPDLWLEQHRHRFRQDRYSFLLEGDLRPQAWEHLQVTGSVGVDLGEYQSPQTGFMLGVSWSNLY